MESKLLFQSLLLAERPVTKRAEEVITEAADVLFCPSMFKTQPDALAVRLSFSLPGGYRQSTTQAKGRAALTPPHFPDFCETFPI
jgi:hypothetical protein